MRGPVLRLILQGIIVSNTTIPPTPQTVSLILFSDEDHNNAENYNFDSPLALDFDLAYEKVKELLEYKDVKIPIYDFALHKR